MALEQLTPEVRPFVAAAQAVRGASRWRDRARRLGLQPGDLRVRIGWGDGVLWHVRPLPDRAYQDEPAPLDPLGEQAQPLTIMPEQLDEIAASLTKREHGSRVGVLLHDLLRYQREAAHALAHVGGTARKPDPRRRAARSSFGHRQHAGQRLGIDRCIDAEPDTARQIDRDAACGLRCLHRR